MTIQETLNGAISLEYKFKDLIRCIDQSYRHVKPSEMLFLSGTVDHLSPKRFVETRAEAGQSALHLALCYPDATVISVDPQEPELAKDRLSDVENVELKEGEPDELLPEMVEQDDVVMIDGASGFAALRFAFELLATGKPAAVFIHDFYAGSPARKFVEENLPHAFFSDDPAFVSQFSYLDSNSLEKKPEISEIPMVGSEPERYGSTFVCIPRSESFSARRFAWLIWKRGLWRRMESLKRILQGRPADVALAG